MCCPINCCCLCGRNSSKNSKLTSALEHLYSCSDAQYDRDLDSRYPFIEICLNLNLPELPPPQIRGTELTKLPSHSSFPKDFSSLSSSDKKIVSLWISMNHPTVKVFEDKRAHALRQIPLQQFSEVKQLDLYCMGLSPAEIIERVNTLINPTLLNLKECNLSDESFAKMRLPSSLKKLVLSNNPITEKSLGIISRAGLDKLESLHLDRTQISKEAALQLATTKLQIFI